MKSLSTILIYYSIIINKGLAKESQYFQTHPKYRHYLSKCGTSNMSRCLNQMLMHHIRDCLPEIKSNINHLLRDVTTNMAALGENVDEQSIYYIVLL